MRGRSGWHYSRPVGYLDICARAQLSGPCRARFPPFLARTLELRPARRPGPGLGHHLARQGRVAAGGERVASITTAGHIRPGIPFSPDKIAEKYWSVVQSDGTWRSEFRFDGT
jgi:hypothetical protein